MQSTESREKPALMSRARAAGGICRMSRARAAILHINCGLLLVVVITARSPRGAVANCKTPGAGAGGWALLGPVLHTPYQIPDTGPRPAASHMTPRLPATSLGLNCPDKPLGATNGTRHLAGWLAGGLAGWRSVSRQKARPTTGDGISQRNRGADVGLETALLERTRHTARLPEASASGAQAQGPAADRGRRGARAGSWK
jgi:hypothetical protein